MGVNSVSAAGGEPQGMSYKAQMDAFNRQIDALCSTIKPQAEGPEDLKHAADVKEKIAAIKEQMAQLAEKNGDPDCAAQLREEKNIILAERDQCLKEYNQSGSIHNADEKSTSSTDYKKVSVFTQQDSMA